MYRKAQPKFTDQSPKTPRQLEELRKAYRKAWGRDLPLAVEMNFNAEEEAKEEQ